MARKITPETNAAPPKDDPAEDLGVLFPEVTLTIAGREITIREYTFMEGLKVRAKAHDLLRDIQTALEGGDLLTEDLLDVMAKHDRLFCELLATSIGDADTAWVDGLQHSAEGEALMLAWWSVCGPFFVRAIARRVGQAMQVRNAFAGSTSLPPSPALNTAASASSPSGSRSVN